MKKEHTQELLMEYEDLILEFSRKMQWVLKRDNGKRYRLAVYGDIHNRTIDKLEKVHAKLWEYSK